MEEFENWLESLPIQTLTNELKEEILYRINHVTQEAYSDGRISAFEESIKTINKIIA